MTRRPHRSDRLPGCTRWYDGAVGPPGRHAMNTDNLAAEILHSGARGFADLAAERLLARVGGSASRFGAAPAQLWREHLRGRVSDLARAVAEARPEDFVDQIGWAKVAFASRELPVEDLAASLDCLRDVLAEELPPAARDDALSVLDAARGAWPQMGVDAPSTLQARTKHGRLIAKYILALLEGERARAGDLLLGAVRDGELSVREALTEVCAPAERELGRMWHVNESTVAEEHFVSATTIRVISQLMTLAKPAPPNGRSVLVASGPWDEHDIGGRIVAELLELEGWRVVFLGARLPVAELVWATGAFGADLVVLSAAMDEHRRGVAEAIAALRASAANRPVLVGGAAFEGPEELWRDVGADACARSSGEALAAARRLVGD